MALSSSFFFFLYLGAIAFITLLGIVFYLFKKRYGNVLFLSEGKIKLSEETELRIKKVLPFLGEGYLIFVEITTKRGKYYEVWGFSKGGGFVKISKIGEH